MGGGVCGGGGGRLRGQAGSEGAGLGEKTAQNTPPTIQGEARANSCATAEWARMKLGEEDDKR